MALKWGLELLATNVGMEFHLIVLLISIITTLPFFAKDYKLGLIINMAIQGAIFVWFHEVGLDFKYNLVAFFIFLVLLSISLFSVNKTSPTGGFSG